MGRMRVGKAQLEAKIRREFAAISSESSIWAWYHNAARSSPRPPAPPPYLCSVKMLNTV